MRQPGGQGAYFVCVCERECVCVRMREIGGNEGVFHQSLGSEAG